MISERHRFIFIHIEKTAGNSLTEVLLPLSDDHVTASMGRPATPDWFGLRGPVTRQKHMPLKEYLALGEGRFDDYAVLASLRHPLDRMLSFYFLPNRWVRQRIPMGFRVARRLNSTTTHRMLTKREEPVWDQDDFLSRVARMPTQSDMLRLPDGSVRMPDWTLDLSNADASLRQLGLLIGVEGLGPLPTRNVGSAPEMVKELRKREDLALMVRNAHMEDYEKFGFPLLPK